MIYALLISANSKFESTIFFDNVNEDSTWNVIEVTLFCTSVQIANLQVHLFFFFFDNVYEDPTWNVISLFCFHLVRCYFSISPHMNGNIHEKKLAY